MSKQKEPSATATQASLKIHFNDPCNDSARVANWLRRFQGHFIAFLSKTTRKTRNVREHFVTNRSPFNHSFDMAFRPH